MTASGRIDDSLRQSRQSDDAVCFGEIVSASVVGLSAECLTAPGEDQLATVLKPRFGSFLRVESEDSQSMTYAVVYNIVTGPRDNLHRPSALGMSRKELRLAQPHIFSLLRTEIQAQTIGYSQAGRFYRHLPPQPPEVHDFVFAASPNEVAEITEAFDFLRLLSAVASVPADELFAAAIREAYEARGCDYEFLVAAGQSLSQLLRNDYDRLLCVLRKIRPDGDGSA